MHNKQQTICIGTTVVRIVRCEDVNEYKLRRRMRTSCAKRWVRRNITRRCRSNVVNTETEIGMVEWIKYCIEVGSDPRHLYGTVPLGSVQ